MNNTDPLLQYAISRIIELERLLLVDVPETVWPAEVGLVYAQVESAGDLPAHHRQRIPSETGRSKLIKSLSLKKQCIELIISFLFYLLTFSILLIQ